MITLHFTDLQIHSYQRFNTGDSRLDNCLRVLEDIWTFADKNGIKVITFGGDLFDSQKALPIKVINKTTEKFKELTTKFPEIVMVAISGNHDHDAKNLPNAPAQTSIQFLATAFPNNIMLLDNHTIFIEEEQIAIHGVPYYEYSEHFKEKLTERAEEAANYKAKGYKNLLMIHQTPSGIGNPNIKVDTEITDPIYDVFDFVWCGHIHTKQKLSEKFYLGGSPIHRDAGDTGVVKGFWVHDFDFITEPYFYSLQGRYPEFVTVKGTVDMEKHEGNYITVTPTEMIDLPTEEVHDFQKTKTNAELVENYWRVVDGKDKELLTTGLNLLT